MTSSGAQLKNYDDLTNSCKLLACIVIGNQIEKATQHKTVDATELSETIRRMINDPNTRGFVVAAIEISQAIYQCEIKLNIPTIINYYKTMEQEKLAAIEASRNLLVTDPRYVEPEKAESYRDLAKTSNGDKIQLEGLLKNLDTQQQLAKQLIDSILLKLDLLNKPTAIKGDTEKLTKEVNNETQQLKEAAQKMTQLRGLIVPLTNKLQVAASIMSSKQSTSKVEASVSPVETNKKQNTERPSL